MDAPHQAAGVPGDPAGNRGRSLRAYFSSGWAFFLPYLGVYLLYAGLGWPVNPLAGDSRPSLLALYLILHWVHAGLGLLALVGWWRSTAPIARPAGARLAQLWPVLPWILLGGVFLLQSSRWEYPSDSWEHYSRINEWSAHDTVRGNSVWLKSSYFTAYSLVGSRPALQQVPLLSGYVAGMCLLLCWQYYRLALQLGLRAPVAFLFVVLQGVLLGNSVFSFYLYYGLSSTVLSQIAAVALVRLGFRFWKQFPFERNPGSGAGRFALAALGLGLLMALNHVQELGIAFLGLLAATVWGLEQWRPRRGLFLLLGLLLLGLAAIPLWPLSDAVRGGFRSAGWLTPWYTFNILSPGSPAYAKMIQIVGIFGLVNIGAALWLVRRNHAVAWLTLMPLLALNLPVFAIPLAEALARRPLGDIDIFHRMFLGIPAGLALFAAFGDRTQPDATQGARPRALAWLNHLRPSGFVLAVVVLATLLTVPARAPFYNRFWHALSRPPDDLAGLDLLKAFSPLDRSLHHSATAGHFATTQGAGVIATATGVQLVTFNARLYSSAGDGSPALAADTLGAFLERPAHERSVTLFVPSARDLFSPASLAGFQSGHWLPQEVALEHAATPETRARALQLGAVRQSRGEGEFYRLSH